MNVPKVISGVIPPGYEKGEVRFKTQAIDLSVEPLAAGELYRSCPKVLLHLNGVLLLKQFLRIPTIPIQMVLLLSAINTPIVCSVSVANAPSDLQAMSGQGVGTDDVLIGTPTAAQTVITFPEQGVFTVTVSIRSNKTEEWTSAIFNFMAS